MNMSLEKLNTDDALELDRLTKQKKRAERKDNLKEVAKLCNVIGELLARNGLYKEAIAEHESELVLSEALEDRIGSAIACRKIGECFSEMADFEKALCHQNRYLDLAKACDDTIEEQRAWATLGRTYFLKSEALKDKDATTRNTASRQAEKAFINSLEFCERLKMSIEKNEFMRMKARLLLNLGLVYDGRNELKLAAEHFKQAIDKTEKFQLYDDLYRCQFALSCTYQHHGNLSLAVRQMEEAQKCAKKLRDKQMESEALMGKATLYCHIGDYNNARRTIKMANKLGASTLKDKTEMKKMYSYVVKMEEMLDDLETLSPDDLGERAELYDKLGDCAAEMEWYKQAIHFYLQLLECCLKQQRSEKDMIPVYISLAQTYADDKQYDNAIKYYRKELDCRQGDHEQMSRTLLNIAEAEENRGLGYNTVKTTYLEAFENARLAKERNLQVQSLKSLMVVQAEAKKFDHKELTEAKLRKIKDKYNIISDDEEEEEASERDSQGAETDCHVVISDLSESEGSGDEGEQVSHGSTQNRRGVGRRFTSLSVKRNEKGETPLHRACIEGNIKKVKKLVEQGHPLNPRDFCGWLPLHEAANHDCPEIVEYLVTHGAWVNDRGGEHCGGVTPLLDAANCGNMDIMEILLDHGANIHAKDDDGQTAVDCLKSWRDRAEDTLGIEDKQKCDAMLKRLLSKVGSRMKSPTQVSSLRKRKVEEPKVVSPDLDLPDLAPPDRSRRNTSRKTNLSTAVDEESSDSDNDVYHSPPQMNQSESAKDSYKLAIANVGSSAVRRNSQLTSHRPKASQTANSRSALVNDGDVVGDDWLIEDTRPQSKKRKNLDIEKLMTTSLRNSSESNKRQKCSVDPVSERENTDPQTFPEEEDFVNNILDDTVENSDDLDIVTLSQGSDDLDRQGNSDGITNMISNQNSRTSRRQKPRQLKLTRLLYKNKESASDATSTLSNVAVPSDPATMASSSSATGSNSHSHSGPAAMKVKVRVKDKLLLIPVPMSETEQPISWLAKETSQRYYNLYGTRPLVQLCTQDGAILSPDDIISVVLTTGEEVGSVVESWDLPPLQLRYSQACIAHKTVMYRNIQTILQHSNQTGKLVLSDLALRPGQIQPVFRALQCQSNLSELHLTGNKIGDIGMKSLSQVLDTLPNLSIMDLSANQLTASGLRYLTEAVEKTTNQTSGQHCKALQVLTSLSLSHNHLGDGCAQFIISLIKQLPLMEKLGLSSCRLTQKLFQHHRVLMADVLKASSLTRLDISYNPLGTTGVELLLTCLQPTRMTELNLKGTVSSPAANHISKHLLNYTSQAGCVLETLDISDCHFTREDRFHLSRLSINGKCLRRLTFNNNPKLDNEMITLILQEASQTDTVLEELEFNGCGLVSPLASDYLDVLGNKLASCSPLTCVTFSCYKMDPIDVDSLRQIWTDHWRDDAVCDFKGDCVKLTVKNLTACSGS